MNLQPIHQGLQLQARQILLTRSPILLLPLILRLLLRSALRQYKQDINTALGIVIPEIILELQYLILPHIRYLIDVVLN